LNKDAKIIQVDIEQTAISRYFPINTGIVGDVGQITKQLYNELKNKYSEKSSKQWTEKFLIDKEKLYKSREEQSSVNSNFIQPTSIFKSLRRTLPKNSMYTLDAGTLCLQATDSLNYYESPGLFTP